MRVVTQTLDELLGSLRPLTVDWADDVAHRVIDRMKALPVKDTYTDEDVAAILEGGKPLNKLTSADFDDGLLIVRLFLGLSKDQFTGVLTDALGPGGSGLKRYKADPGYYRAALVEQGLLDAMMLEVNKPLHWTDTVVERLRSGRGSAISGQKRGRSAEDFAEDVIREVFGEGNYQVRATFTGRAGAPAKCDFAIPSAANPRIVIESKGFAATGSKMSDVLGDVNAIIKAKRGDTTFLFFTDGLTWKQRQSDLRKLISYQNEGDIARIYTQSMVEQFREDLITLKAECGL
ncbi:MAG TPA: DpnII family type II restriction endonuclease [Roseomonas sp.]|nr:DpnII family type II restriction endonuclease [Roseomonas sp.]